MPAGFTVSIDAITRALSDPFPGVVDSTPAKISHPLEFVWLSPLLRVDTNYCEVTKS